MWVAATGVRKDEQAIRSWQDLSGEAFQKPENMDTETVRHAGGVADVKQAIENVYEPIEEYRIDKSMDEVLSDFSRRRNQEIVDYNLAWARELRNSEKLAGDLTPK